MPVASVLDAECRPAAVLILRTDPEQNLLTNRPHCPRARRGGVSIRRLERLAS